MYETLLVNDVDLNDIVSCIQVLDGLYAASTFRGDDLTIPGLNGSIFTDKPFGSGTIDVGLVLSGSTTTEFNDQYRVLKTLIEPGRQLTLTRRLSYSTGNEEHVTTATYASGLNPSMSLMRFGKVTVSFKILDGLWYATSPNTLLITSSFGLHVNIGGEARTSNMTLSFPVGTTLTQIANVTTNDFIGFDPSLLTISHTPTDVVTIDVPSATATIGVNDVSNCMTWRQRNPMRFYPGDNVFLTTQTITAHYYTAYL